MAAREVRHIRKEQRRGSVRHVLAARRGDYREKDRYEVSS